MKLGLYAIRDITQNQFMRVNQHFNDGDATRTFTEVVNNTEQGNLINKYPEQFELYALATIDSETGEVTPEKRQIGTAASYKR